MPVTCADLLWQHITQVAGPELLPAVVGYFGLAFLRGVTVFTLVELVNELGIGVFDGGQVDAASFRLRDLFRTADAGRQRPGAAARGLPGTAGRRVPAQPAGPRRRARRGTASEADRGSPGVPAPPQPGHQPGRRRGAAGDCVVPAGVYLVGPGHHLMLRRVATAGPAGPVPGHRRPLQAVPGRRRAPRVSRVGSPGHAQPGTPTSRGRTGCPCPATTTIPPTTTTRRSR